LGTDDRKRSPVHEAMTDQHDRFAQDTRYLAVTFPQLGPGHRGRPVSVNRISPEGGGADLRDRLS
jgi:hypothetical protein